jgi:hypothetical protein
MVGCLELASRRGFQQPPASPPPSPNLAKLRAKAFMQQLHRENKRFTSEEQTSLSSSSLLHSSAGSPAAVGGSTPRQGLLSLQRSSAVSNVPPSPSSSPRRRLYNAEEEHIRRRLKEQLRYIKQLSDSYRRSKGNGANQLALKEKFQVASGGLDGSVLSVAEPEELFFLLRAAKVFGAHSSHISASAAKYFVSNAATLPPKVLVQGLEEMAESSWMLSSSDRTSVCGILLTELLSPTAQRPKVLLLEKQEHMTLLRLVLNRIEAIFPLYLGSTLTLRTMLRFIEDDRWQNSLSGDEVALICRCILYFHLEADPQIITFFIVAAPILDREAEFLSPHSLSHILSALAAVQYPDAKLFLKLGQLAGEMGDRLHENDAARVLNAFSRTNINCDRLRTALESAMRMKHLNRRPIYRDK